ncbi:MAG: hypothetical protein FWH33_05160 [Oscillospiraceae bacterium]|nr:hypothetical protein [Oscillospiraceae bacterium]
MRIEKCVVSYDDWEMQCCGDPFKIGDRIKWPVYKRVDEDNIDTDSALDGVDYIYEAHGMKHPRDMYTLIGTVDEIKADYYKIELRTRLSIHNGQKPVPTHVYEKSFDVTEADGWDKDIDDLEFGSYRVTIRDCELLPYKE